MSFREECEDADRGRVGRRKTSRAMTPVGAPEEGHRQEQEAALEARLASGSPFRTPCRKAGLSTSTRAAAATTQPTPGSSAVRSGTSWGCRSRTWLPLGAAAAAPLPLIAGCGPVPWLMAWAEAHPVPVPRPFPAARVRGSRHARRLVPCPPPRRDGHPEAGEKPVEPRRSKPVVAARGGGASGLMALTAGHKQWLLLGVNLRK